MPEIVQWTDIADAYSDTLLVGNGASMAVDGSFSYKSLLDKAREEAMITPNVEKLFEYFKTEDFELILRMIWHTFHVNRALEITDDVTNRAYADVRNALVQAVRGIHPPHERVVAHLDRIYPFMQQFDEVVSLNYDLLVYWAMLRGNEELGTWFKDCFVNGSFDSEWDRFYTPFGRAKGATLVFYPHGNLVLATALERSEFKISRNDDWEALLERVITEWESEESVPLFVSEGKPQQKQRAISRSDYLNTVYRSVLPTIGPSVVIYGWGMAIQDSHILRQIRAAKAKRIAVSVYCDRAPAHVESECERTRRRLKVYLPDAEVIFFDSASPGCWNVPPDED